MRSHYKEIKRPGRSKVEYGVHPTQIAQWKKQVLDELPENFSMRKQKGEKAEEELKASLYQQIGQLNVELDWLNYPCTGYLAHLF